MQNKRLSKIFANSVGVIVAIATPLVAIGIAGYAGWELGNLLFGEYDLAQKIQMRELTLLDRIEGFSRAGLIILPSVFSGAASIFAGNPSPALRAGGATVKALYHTFGIKAPSSDPA